jgi:ABC-type transport system substrate-binding protein
MRNEKTPSTPGRGIEGTRRGKAAAEKKYLKYLKCAQVPKVERLKTKRASLSISWVVGMRTKERRMEMGGCNGDRTLLGFFRNGSLIVFFFALLFYTSVGQAATEEKPQRGGTLIFAVGGEPPTYDGHRESTFGLIHPISPHYSLLLKFDEDRYPKVVGDLAESWTVTKDQKTFTFKIRKGVKFHDGSILTSKDVKATYDKIIFPPTGVISHRAALYSCVEKVEAPDDSTVVFQLKWASVSFLTSLASPFNYTYKAEILAKNIKWYERNIMGTGPFKFVEHVAGSHWVGKRNEDYFQKGLPYLDGYRALFIMDTSARVSAIRAGRVHVEFRGFPPTQRDDLVRAMGDQVRVQENSMTTCISLIFNTEKKPFGDPRVRRALTLALDRWEGSKALSKMASGWGACCGRVRNSPSPKKNWSRFPVIPGTSRRPGRRPAGCSARRECPRDSVSTSTIAPRPCPTRSTPSGSPTSGARSA